MFLTSHPFLTEERESDSSASLELHPPAVSGREATLGPHTEGVDVSPSVAGFLNLPLETPLLIWLLLCVIAHLRSRVSTGALMSTHLPASSQGNGMQGDEAGC